MTLHHEKTNEALNAAEAAFTSMLQKGKKIIYFGDLGVIGTPKKHTINVGYTDDGPTRIRKLKYSFPSGFRLIHILEHPENKVLEARFKRHPSVLSRQRDIMGGLRPPEPPNPIRDADLITEGGQIYAECYEVNEGMTVEGYTNLLGQLAQGLKKHVQTGWADE